MKTPTNITPLHHATTYTRLLYKALLSPLLIYLALVGNLFTLCMAWVFWKFEATPVNENVTHFFDALWWALITVSSIGYGDIVPVTTMGRVAGLGLIVVGLTLFFTFMAALFSSMLALASEEVQKASQIRSK